MERDGVLPFNFPSLSRGSSICPEAAILLGAYTRKVQQRTISTTISPLHLLIPLPHLPKPPQNLLRQLSPVLTSRDIFFHLPQTTRPQDNPIPLPQRPMMHQPPQRRLFDRQPMFPANSRQAFQQRQTCLIHIRILEHPHLIHPAPLWRVPQLLHRPREKPAPQGREDVVIHLQPAEGGEQVKLGPSQQRIEAALVDGGHDVPLPGADGVHLLDLGDGEVADAEAGELAGAVELVGGGALGRERRQPVRAVEVEDVELGEAEGREGGAAVGGDRGGREAAGGEAGRFGADAEMGGEGGGEGAEEGFGCAGAVDACGVEFGDGGVVVFDVGEDLGELG